MKTVSAVELDAIDRKMLRLLQQDGRITNADLARQVALSESACLRRLRALEAAGVVLADDPSTDRSGRRLRYRVNRAAYEGAVAAIRRLIA